MADRTVDIKINCDARKVNKAVRQATKTEIERFLATDEGAEAIAKIIKKLDLNRKI